MKTMKNWLSYMIAIAFLASIPLHAQAVEEQRDTVFFYNTWEQLFYHEPDLMVYDPYVYVNTPFDIYLGAEDKVLNDSIRDIYMVAAFGDSTYLINSKYLRREFGGDADRLRGYIPFAFNERVAYTGKLNVTGDKLEYYYIDFVNREVLRVTPKVLSDLLEDYHDLQMRYEGMKDYKKSEIIEDYFFKYIDRAVNDVMRPSVLDLME